MRLRGGWVRRRPGAARYDVSVVSSGHDVADARLHRIVAALLRAGLRVEVIGLGDPAAGPPGADVRALPRGSMQRRALRAVRLPFTASGRVLLTPNPDMAPAAVVRRTVRGGAVVMDVQEDYAALLHDRAWARGPRLVAARAVAGLGTWLAARADVTVVADEHVPPARARQRLVVRNLPDRGHLPPLQPPDERPRALYIGDVRASRGLPAMLETLAAAPSWRLDIVGQVAAADAAWLDRRVAAPDLAGRVHTHGRLPPAAAWRFAAGAWAGLAMLDDTPAFRDALPSKVYEYLACGIPVVVTPLPRMVDLVRASGAGEVASSAAEAAAVLRCWESDPAEHARRRQAALRWAAEHMAEASPYDDLARAVSRLVRP